MSDIESLVEIDKTTVRTNHIRQTIIDSRYKDWDIIKTDPLLSRLDFLCDQEI